LTEPNHPQDKTINEYPLIWVEGIKEKDSNSFLNPNDK
jgi:hypothetical protein